MEDNVKRLKDSGIKYIITVRDPRDDIISQYYYSRNHPEFLDYPSASSKSLSRYITYKLESGEFDKWLLNWIRMWLDKRDRDKSIIIRYEDVLKDTYFEMKKVFDFLEINCSESRLRQII